MLKKVCCTCKVAIVVLFVFTLSLDFIFSLRKLQILKGASLLALAKSMYYLYIVQQHVAGIYLHTWVKRNRMEHKSFLSNEKTMQHQGLHLDLQMFRV